jgi:hypothetical protein
MTWAVWGSVRVKVVLLQDDVAIFLVLEALDEFGAGDRLVFFLAVEDLFDAGVVGVMELVEGHGLAARGGAELDGEADHAEGDVALPDGAGHGYTSSVRGAGVPAWARESWVKRESCMLNLLTGGTRRDTVITLPGTECKQKRFQRTRRDGRICPARSQLFEQPAGQVRWLWVCCAPGVFSLRILQHAHQFHFLRRERTRGNSGADRTTTTAISMTVNTDGTSRPTTCFAWPCSTRRAQRPLPTGSRMWREGRLVDNYPQQSFIGLAWWQDPTPHTGAPLSETCI